MRRRRSKNYRQRLGMNPKEYEAWLVRQRQENERLSASLEAKYGSAVIDAGTMTDAEKMTTVSSPHDAVIKSTRHGDRGHEDSMSTDTISPKQIRGQLVSIDDAARYLGLSPGTLRNWVSMRRIEFVKIGRLTRIAQMVLDRYIAEHTVHAHTDDDEGL